VISVTATGAEPRGRAGKKTGAEHAKVQTTLLGLAVAIILALVAALVGPLFVDWGRWRTTFEAEATRLVGMPVRVSGRIDARLLPTPSLLLNGIEVGPSGEEPKLRARTLGVEFALGSLMRGEWRAAELHLDGPEVALGVDAAGRIDMPQVSIGFDADQLSFDRVAIDDGRVTLRHAASETAAVLDRVSFRGDVRSLNGPFRGEGGFVSSGQLYGYRVSGSRRDDDGGMRLRLAIDPADRPLTIESDGTLSFERERPRYEGNLVLARPVGFALPSGATVASEPWRATSRIRITSAGALLEDVEFKYGPEERALTLAGTAELKFGAKPSLEGVLSARQIDLDRAVQPDPSAATPIARLRRIGDGLAGFAHPPFPVKVGVGVDNVLLGGKSLVAVRGDLIAADGAWSLDSLEFRAPGATQVRASGRLTLASGADGFVGPASVESADPKTLIAWLEGRPDPDRPAPAALQARGDVTLGGERLAVERLKAEFDRKAIEGRLAYEFATDRHPARLDAALSAAEVDLDGALAFAGNALAGTTLERPRDIALALDFGRASYAGVEAKGATANLKFDASGLVIERLAIADFGGAVLNASGRIDTTSASPRGSISLALDAQRLAGVTALAARFWPGAADLLARVSQHAPSAKLAAKLDVAPVAAAAGAKTDTRTSAKLALDGAIAGVHIDLAAEGKGDVAKPAAAEVRLDGRLDADDGAALAALVGLDRLATVDKRPAKLALSANGPADGDLRVDAKFEGSGLDAAARGTLRVADRLRPRGELDVIFAASAVRLPHRDAAAALPVTLTTRLSLDGDRIALDGLDGKVAGAAVKGRLALALGQPTRIEGRLDADTVDATAVIAAAIGASPAPRGSVWSSEPFVATPLADMEGRLDVAAARAVLASGIAVRQLRASLRIEPTAIAFDKIEGSLGEGRLAAQAEFRAAPTGLAMQAHVSLTNADLSALMPRTALGQAAGRVSLELDAGGAGLSPAALIGALQGRGSATGESLQLSGLDPKAIDAAVLAAERGVPVDAIRIGDIVRTALDSGRLNIPDVAGTLAIGDGRVRLGPVNTPAQDADVVLSGSYSLGEDALDLRFGLTGAPKDHAPGGQRPALAVALTGPPAAPRRNVDVTALVNWLTLRGVEREAKRLEAAEREAKRIQAQEEDARRRAAEDAARRAQEAATSSAAAPAFDKAPELPPAIEIGPTPGAPERKPRHVPAEHATPLAPAAPLVIAPPPAR
jgi:large subunit ribosomal protein L24